MKTAARVFAIFRNMPQREKLLVIFLTVVFLFSFGKFILDQIRFPVRAEKGVFSEGMVGHIRDLNPLFVDFNDVDRDLSQLIFSGLMRFDPAQRNFVPDLAETVERSRDGRSYTLKLRPNIFWHDETPLTVDDIFFTFRDVIQDPGFRNPILKNEFEGVTVESPAENTITFTLSRPNAYFLSYITVGIVPKHLLLDTPIASLDRAQFGIRPIGTGPYRVTRLRQDDDGDEVELAAFPKYYGQPPKINRLKFFTFTDEETLLEERGALHAFGKISVASEGMKEAAEDSRFSVSPYTLNQFSAIFLNTDHPFLKEKKVRQAMAFALDKNLLVGEGERRLDSLDFENHENEAAFAFHLDQASKILDELGFKAGAEGFRVNTKGDKIVLRFLALKKTDVVLLEKIKNAWQTLGIQILLEKAEGSDFFDLVSSRKYDALLIRQNLGYNRDVYSLFHSSQTGEASRNGLNFANFRSFRTDGLTEAIRKEKDSKDREKMFAELIKAITEEMPVIFLSTPVYGYAIDKRFPAFPLTALDFHADRLSILPYLIANY